MTQEVKDALLRYWVNPEDEEYIDEAIVRINEEKVKWSGLPKGYDFTHSQLVKRWEYVFHDDGEDSWKIDDVIAKLQEFKEKGFPFVEIAGYDDDLVAYRHVRETPEEIADRIHGRVIAEIESIKKGKEIRKQKMARLEELKKEVAKLEKELNDED